MRAGKIDLTKVAGNAISQKKDDSNDNDSTTESVINDDRKVDDNNNPPKAHDTPQKLTLKESIEKDAESETIMTEFETCIEAEKVVEQHADELIEKTKVPSSGNTSENESN